MTQPTRGPSTADPDRLVTVTMPLSHWRQIVSDIENMCGTGDHSEIEILSQFEVSDPPTKARLPVDPA
jgi:hypothetical protein